MNTGTRIRTILVIATCFNTALMATDITQFNNPKLDLIYRILSVVANFIIVFCATWFNNDYTEAGAFGTAVTRQIKAEQTEGYIGEYFFTEEAEEESEEEDDDI